MSWLVGKPMLDFLKKIIFRLVGLIKSQERMARDRQRRRDAPYPTHPLVLNSTNPNAIRQSITPASVTAQGKRHKGLIALCYVRIRLRTSSAKKVFVPGPPGVAGTSIFARVSRAPISLVFWSQKWTKLEGYWVRYGYWKLSSGKHQNWWRFSQFSQILGGPWRRNFVGK